MEDYQLFSIVFINVTAVLCFGSNICTQAVRESGLKRQTQNLKQILLVQKIYDLFLIGIEKIIQLVIKCPFQVIKNIIAIFS
jgi:hypothetical protein